jgi:hypothetical protein
LLLLLLLLQVTGHKSRRCMLPYKHNTEECLAYHVHHPKQASASGNMDPRRPVLVGGAAAYSPELCPAMAADVGRDKADQDTPRLYISCSKGAACDMSHSVMEAGFHPLRYKRRRCGGGDQCRAAVKGESGQLVMSLLGLG